MTRISITALVLTTVTGCRAVPETKSDDTVGYNLEDTGTTTDTAEDTSETGTIGDDTAQTDTGTDDTAEDTGSMDTGTEDTGSETPTIVDQCAGLETPASATVDTYFTSAWSAGGAFEATLGDTVNFGAIELSSPTGVDLTVNGLVVFPFIDEDGDGVYTADEESGVNARDYIGECVLREATSRAVYAGPVELDTIDGGRLAFFDAFTVSGSTATAVNIECTTKGTVPSGERIGVAMDVLWLFQSVFVTESGGSSLIGVRRCATNGTQSVFTLQPAVAARFSG